MMVATILILHPPSASLVMSTTICRDHAVCTDSATDADRGCAQDVHRRPTFHILADCNDARLWHFGGACHSYGLPQHCYRQEAGIWLRQACAFARSGFFQYVLLQLPHLMGLPQQ